MLLNLPRERRACYWLSLGSATIRKLDVRNILHLSCFLVVFKLLVRVLGKFFSPNIFVNLIWNSDFFYWGFALGQKSNMKTSLDVPHCQIV